MINFVVRLIAWKGSFMKIEVLGIDRATCKTLFQGALEALRLSGKKGRSILTDDVRKILRYGVAVPTLVVNGAIVFSGNHISPEEILALLQQNISPFT